MRKFTKITERLIKIHRKLLKEDIERQMELRKWKRYGFTPEEIDEWQDAGVFNAKDAKIWKDAGFTPQEAREWSWSLSPSEMIPWVKIFAVWKNAGFTYDEASDWWEADFFSENEDVEEEKKIVEEVIEWKKFGFNPEEAKEWHKLGFTPSEAFDLKKKGYIPETAKEIKK